MHYKWISIECAYNICIRIFMHNSNHSAEKKAENKIYCWIGWRKTSVKNGLSFS